MGEKTVLKNLFSSGEEKIPESEKKKRDYQKNYDSNPFINKKSIDPKGGIKKFWIFRDSMAVSIEESYYWIRRFMEKGTGAENLKELDFGGGHGVPHGFGLNAFKVYKLKDVFDASVASSFHGQIGTKITAIQQQVSNTLSQIGQMVKSLFPIVREIRIMDERLSYYKNSFCTHARSEVARENEVTLKSTWIEVVEQGMQNPNSVYSISTKVGFMAIPDMFFAINPHGMTVTEQKKRIPTIIKQMAKDQELNQKVRDVLTKKLLQYYTWKETTYNEMKHTWKFRIKNLKQHYNVIRLYISWLKPYLTSLKQLQMKNDEKTPDLVSAFETSKMELELLGQLKKGKKYSACILVRMTYVTRPELNYTPQGQKQPVHVGHMTIHMEPYVATQEEIDFYIDHSDKETFKMFSGEEIDMVHDIEESMKSLGEDVEEYLREAETGKREKEDDPMVKAAKEGKGGDFFEPFTALMGSFKIFLPDLEKKSSKKSGVDDLAQQGEYGSMKKTAAGRCWNLYDIYKKAHGMFTP
jgi:hypothetical protein